jgi:hypothetical protein
VCLYSQNCLEEVFSETQKFRGIKEGRVGCTLGPKGG